VGMVSIEVLSFLLAFVGVLIAWFSYSSGRKKEQRARLVEQTKIDTVQEEELKTLKGAVQGIYIQITKLEKDIDAAFSKIVTLDKKEVLDSKDIEQLRTEMSRLVSLHEKLYAMILDLFRQQTGESHD